MPDINLREGESINFVNAEGKLIPILQILNAWCLVGSQDGDMNGVRVGGIVNGETGDATGGVMVNGEGDVGMPGLGATAAGQLSMNIVDGLVIVLDGNNDPFQIICTAVV